MNCGSGSPPHMRGKAKGDEFGLGQTRITPAYAGKRRCPRFRPGKIRDHPRTCGEKAVCPSPLTSSLGSPPRMRGKVSSCRPAACACRDHPRVCGEKFSPAVAAQFWKGSPPHVRGKVHVLASSILRSGITPACAGKSRTERLPVRQGEDHPRMCGEKQANTWKNTAGLGSPPHVRGKDPDCPSRSGCLGITPACAGKRPQWRSADSGR